MKLLRLNLVNFQGIKAIEYVFDGNSASIYGDNATGKTTIFNALTWLLFDKASTGAKNFTPKTKGPDGDLHFLDHAVEGVLRLTDGRQLTLKKVFHENYKKKRGSATEEFDGHSVDFFLDGVPAQEKEYNKAVGEFCGDAEAMKMLTMPNYFPEEMGWEERRKILLEICGDVSDADVIRCDTELGELNGYLLMPGTKDQLYTVDEYRKIAWNKKTDINRQMEGIPGRIDEAQRAVPDLAGASIKAIEAQIKELNLKKQEAETELARIQNGDNVAAGLRKQIADANAEMAEARAVYARGCSGVNEETYAAIEGIKRLQQEARNHAGGLDSTIDTLERATRRLNEIREDLLKEYDLVLAEVWDPKVEVCPTCRRELPADQVNGLREKFNVSKSARLEHITKRGKREASKAMIDANYAQIKELQEQRKRPAQALADLDQQLEVLQKKLTTPPAFETTKDYLAIAKRIEGYHAATKNQDGQTASLTAEVRAKIDGIQAGIRLQEDLRGKINLAKTQQDRVAELAAQEKALGKEYENIARGIYLCELFVKTKVGLLNDRINAKFACVRFRLFIQQQNGGITESCDVLIPCEGGRMVPYAFANNGARINAGLEIIETLSKHWNLEIPCFIDNAESVTALRKMDTQLIRLVVSEADKKLRVEIDAENREKAAPKGRGKGK